MKRQKKQLLALALVLLALVLAGVGIYAYQKHQEKQEEEENEASVEVYRTDAGDISEIFFEADGNQTLHLMKQEDAWVAPENAETEIDQDAVSTTVEDLCDVKASRVLENKDASEYGFDNPLGQLKLVADGQEILFTIGMQNDLTGEYYLVKDNDTSRVYVVDDSLYTLAQKTTEDYAVIESEEEDDTDTSSESE